MDKNISRRKSLKSTASLSVSAPLASAFSKEEQDNNIQKAPNIIFITADMVAAKHFGCYGHPAKMSPNIDKLAQKGVLFEQAYCASTPCIPARACMYTGLYAHTHGKTSHVKMALEPQPPLIPEVMTKKGYQTAVVGKTHFWPPTSDLGAQKAYLTIDSHLRKELGDKDAYMKFLEKRKLKEYFFKEMGPPPLKITPPKMPPETLRANWTGDTVCSLIDEFSKEQKPFFIYGSFVSPHGSRSIQQKHLDAVKDIPLNPIIGLENEQRYKLEEKTKPKIQRRRANLLRENRPLKAMRDHFNLMRRGLQASLGLIDQNIGKIVNKLKALNIADNTCIIFSADHGDLVGDHMLTEKTFLYEGAVRIPLIITGPGIKPQQKRNHLTSQVDFFPTILGLANIKDKELFFEGKDLTKIIKNPKDKWRKYIYCEVDTTVHLNSVKPPIDSSISKMLRTGPWKYIYTLVDGYITEHELYNLEDDPDEMKNLAYNSTTENQKRIQNFQNEIFRWLLATEQNRLRPVPQNDYKHSNIDEKYF